MWSDITGLYPTGQTHNRAQKPNPNRLSTPLVVHPRAPPCYPVMESPVWKFFTKNSTGVTCNLCGSLFPRAADGSTSNLINHLTGRHHVPKEYQQHFPAAAPSAQLTFAARPPRAQVIRVLLRWLLADLQPLSLPNSPYFRDFVALLGLPDNFIPDASNLTRTYLPKLYEIGKAVVRDALVGSSSISCTFDAWTEEYSTRSYVTLSVYVLKEWKLRTLCLTTRHVKESHTAVFLSEWVKVQLEEFGVSLQAPLLAATTDTTASMVNTVANLGVIFMPCLAHTINLIMKDIFDIPELHDFITRMARICKFVRKSTTATELLETAAKENEASVRADAITVYGRLKVEAKRQLPVRLKRMVKTRWNSAYDMLVRLWVLYPPLLTIVPRLVARKVAVPDALKEASIADRENIFRIRIVLYDLVQATKEVQEQATPVLSKTLLTLFFARKSLQRIAHTDQGLAKRIATKASDSLHSRVFSSDSLFRKPQTIAPSILPAPFIPLHPISSAFSVAVLVAALDPRTSKFLLSELRAAKLLQSVPGSAHADPVRPHIVGLVRNAALLDGPVASAMPVPAAAAAPAIVEEEEVIMEDTQQYWTAKRAKVVPLVVTGTLEDQLQQFLNEEIDAKYEAPDSDPLIYWKLQSKRWPLLAAVACRFFVVMPSSAEAERTFSTAGDIVTPERACLKPAHVDMLLFLAKNIRSGVITADHLLDGVRE